MVNFTFSISYKKLVDLNDLHTWSSFLSLRDKLIAYLIYLDAPSVEKILGLTVEHINWGSISFEKEKMEMPPEFMKILRKFCIKKKSTELVFVNCKGEEVARPHLNHAFKRASKKSKIDITIAKLKRFKRHVK